VVVGAGDAAGDQHPWLAGCNQGTGVVVDLEDDHDDSVPAGQLRQR
jgi:hypothetical protein